MGVSDSRPDLPFGLRVVRGPDWKWEEQDGGEGHVGTLVEATNPADKLRSDQIVYVQWDNGTRANYRIGCDNAYDLRLFDNAQSGVIHSTIVCDACNQDGICGIRWKCGVCFNYDLCTPCYYSGKHDLSHHFIRFIAPNYKGVEVSMRRGRPTRMARGIFVGATVRRGPSWSWRNQDGGEGKTGEVIGVEGWGSKTQRSGMKVRWQGGGSNTYRLGYEGKVDLIFKTAANGGVYYPEHLPRLGDPAGLVEISSGEFKVGDKVKMDLDPELLEIMQADHGGWVSSMAEYRGKVGTVQSVKESGDIQVKYPGQPIGFIYHPGALTKISVMSFKVGDVVRISDDLDTVKELQEGHGGWNEKMKHSIGKAGKIVRVDSDGDLRISVNGNNWFFNPQCCTQIPADEQASYRNAENSTTEDSSDTDALSLLATLLRHALELGEGNEESQENKTGGDKSEVNGTMRGTTVLHIACGLGDEDTVKKLLSLEMDIEVKDNDGDSCLHHSVFGQQPTITRILIEHGVNVNAVNNKGQSALHIAINKKNVACAKILLTNNCNVNIQDSFGDTALHDAIRNEHSELITALCEHDKTIYAVKNKRGFNPLHQAALSGNACATEQILARASDLVDVMKEDGFTALHLSAFNDHSNVAKILITKGKANLEKRNKENQTPLMLAVMKGYPAVAHLLVEAGADIHAADSEKHSCLHLAVLAYIENKYSSQVDCESTDAYSSKHAQIARYLVQHGADVKRKDSNGRDALALAAVDPALQEYITHAEKSPSYNKCVVCCLEQATIRFQPCGHTIACTDCSVIMNKCLSCQKVIGRKLKHDGSEVPATAAARQPVAEESKILKQQLQEYEESFQCNICLDNRLSIVFLCGHSACKDCAEAISQCHMCREPIVKRIQLYR